MSQIEILTSYDTTGSMYPCITQVRREIKSLTLDLFSAIPGLRMGMIAHGDYCDKGSAYVIKEEPFTSDETKLVRFINDTGNTYGGDAPECYELVLNKARAYNWTATKSKILVLIGDDVPHEVRDNPGRLDWKNEAKILASLGVKVYAVQCLNRRHATSFYSELAEITDGLHLTLDQFAKLPMLLQAIAYKQQGNDVLQQFVTLMDKANKLDKNTFINVSILLDGSIKRPRIAVAKAVEAKYGKTDLTSVSPGRFQVMEVDEDVSIRDFVEDNGLTFKKGRGFYQFTKSVKVQAYKEVILYDKKTGEFFSGDRARELAGIPIGTECTVSPDKKNSKYMFFIQSTSYNRKLLSGTSFLYEVEDYEDI